MHKKIRIILVIMLLSAIGLAFLTACEEVDTDLTNKTDYRGSGEVKSEAEALEEEEYKLVVKNVFTNNGVLNIEQGGNPSAAVMTNTNILETLSIKVISGVITIEGNEEYYYKTEDFAINIGAKVKEIEIYGAFDINIDQDGLSQFEIVINGACKGSIDVGSVNRFDLTANGAGNLDITGSCEEGKIVLNGASKINASGLIGQNMDVEINGAGNIDVYATGNLNAIVNGVGIITYEGDPTVTKQVYGLGNIKAK